MYVYTNRTMKNINIILLLMLITAININTAYHFICTYELDVSTYSKNIIIMSNVYVCSIYSTFWSSPDAAIGNSQLPFEQTFPLE